VKISFKSSLRLALIVVLGGVLAACAVEPRSASPELLQRIESARTRADHESLAAYYDQQAAASRSSADEHRRMAKSYGMKALNPRGSGPYMTDHCEGLVTKYEGIAAEFSAMAAGHRQMGAMATP
jgi:hypothetical protein